MTGNDKKVDISEWLISLMNVIIACLACYVMRAVKLLFFCLLDSKCMRIILL